MVKKKGLSKGMSSVFLSAKSVFESLYIFLNNNNGY